jgi:hypothetical protein
LKRLDGYLVIGIGDHDRGIIGQFGCLSSHDTMVTRKYDDTRVAQNTRKYQVLAYSTIATDSAIWWSGPSD